MSSMPSQRHRGGWILPLFLVAMPFVEIYLIVQIGQIIGVWWTLGILIGEALLGAWLMKREGSRASKALNQAYASGTMPTGELADAALILVGGVLLVLPGFVTDIFGLVFLLPFTRPLARKLLALFVTRRMSKLGVSTSSVSAMYMWQDGTVIEGETVPDPRPDQDPGAASGPVIIAGEIEEN